MEPIILDRSFLEKYAACPQQGYLSMLFSALKAQAAGQTVFAWEKERIADAEPAIVEQMEALAECGTSNELCQTGIAIHDVVDAAFKECGGNLELIPDWITENMPKIRPDLQPDAIRAGRYIADQLADLHVRVIGTEIQLSFELFPQTASRPAVIVAMRIDLLAQGINQSLHVWDWKSGYKQRTNSEAVDSFQGQCGACVLWKQDCYAQVETIHWWYQECRYGTRAYARYSRSSEHPRTPHLTQMLAFENRIEQAARLFLNNSQECWPTETKCSQCDMVYFCRMRHLAADEIADSPRLFIDKLAYDLASVSRRKKAATAWVKAKGPICGSVCTYDRKPPAVRFTCEMIETPVNSPAKSRRKNAAAIVDISADAEAEQDVGED